MDCGMSKYCSPECRDKDHETVHQYECRVLRTGVYQEVLNKTASEEGDLIVNHLRFAVKFIMKLLCDAEFSGGEQPFFNQMVNKASGMLLAF